jgi:hypothetical protein
LEYQAADSVFTAASLILTLLISGYMRHYLDNERYESIISESDGLEWASKMYPSYAKRYLVADTVSAIIAPIIYLLPVLVLPQRVIDTYIPFILDLGLKINSTIGAGTGYIIALLSITAANLISPILVINKWSALWLSLGVVSER